MNIAESQSRPSGPGLSSLQSITYSVSLAVLFTIGQRSLFLSIFVFLCRSQTFIVHECEILDLLSDFILTLHAPFPHVGTEQYTCTMGTSTYAATVHFTRSLQL